MLSIWVAKVNPVTRFMCLWHAVDRDVHVMTY